METTKPRAPLELSLVEIDPTPEDAANAASAADPMSLESVTLQPYHDRRPKPVAAPASAAPLPSLGSLMLAPLDPPSLSPAGPLSLASSEAQPASPSTGLSMAPLEVPAAAPEGRADFAPEGSPGPGSTPAANTPAISGSSGTGPMATSTISGSTRFLQEAMREYEAGRIDQPLWMRAAAQAGGDENVARENYLRARATALKLVRREQRGDATPRGQAIGAGTSANIGANLAGRAITGADARPPAPARKYMAIAASVLVVAAAGAWWFGSGESSAPAANATAAARPVAAAVAAPKPAAPAQPTTEDHAQYFGGKIQELKDAGNWNVLVLFASEWTRKQPANATAWKELALGYSNMRQMEDALQAATKAADLAPQDPAAWRMRAQVNAALDQPEAALQAFERAAVLDDGDLASWVQAGNLSTQLDRLTEARHAFDKVLAANPDHVGALCGKAELAQKAKQPREAEAIARQIKALDGQCREAAVAAVAVAAPAGKGTATNTPAHNRAAARAR
jgi:hypothetical protein